MKLNKNLMIFVLLIIAGATIFIKIDSNHIDTEQKEQIIESSSVAFGKYCMAFRGNGELEPAHWGAASRVIEQWGLPSAMAGGSSGSISMFLINAVAQNPFVTDARIDDFERNRRASLIVKSFLGFFNELKRTRFTKDFFKLYGEFDAVKAEEMTNKMWLAFGVRNYSEVANILHQGLKQGIFATISAEPILRALKNRDEKKSKFYLQQLKESVDLFGKFDAMKDANLFFRPGLIDFEKATASLGRWASFYALPVREESIMKSWSAFIESCSVGSENKTWNEILKEKPQCEGLFQMVFTSYFNQEPQVRFEDRQIGNPIPVYPSTAVLVGESARQVEKAFIDYEEKLSPRFGEKFRAKNPEEVLFGYWGNPASLQNIKSKLDKNDEKSRRFYGLGQASWKTVLSLSPAEPGLASLLPFEAEGKKIFSAGGWSDLHPVNVLKASGCEQVVFLTREGGESLFAQGVAIRLMNLKRDPFQLNPDLNNQGDPSADPKDKWSKLFNLANPKSSVNTALSMATAVACTNWNSYDVKKNLVELIENAYRSAYWIHPKLVDEVNLRPVLKDRKPGCQSL